MRLRILHRTEYQYPFPVRESTNEVRLHPADTLSQECISSFLSIVPAVRMKRYLDLNGNVVHVFSIPEPHDTLIVEARSVVRTVSSIDYEHLPYGFLHTDLEKCRHLEVCVPFLNNSAYVVRTQKIWEKALDIKGDSADVFQTCYAFMDYIHQNFQYDTESTTVMTAAEEVIENQRGVCQDFAHAMVAFCRSLGIPARYVSGYFFDRTRDHSMRGGQSSHGWVEVYIEEHDWVGLDPTNNKVVDDSYVVLAIGRDYRDVAPVVGTYYGRGGSVMNVTVEIEEVI